MTITERQADTLLAAVGGYTLGSVIQFFVYMVLLP